MIHIKTKLYINQTSLHGDESELGLFWLHSTVKFYSLCMISYRAPSLSIQTMGLGWGALEIWRILHFCSFIMAGLA